MNIDKEREAFEKWWLSTDLSNGYHSQPAWESWQARAALLPSVEEIDQILTEADEEGNETIVTALVIRKLLEEPHG